jgi:hypothetical protein
MKSKKPTRWLIGSIRTINNETAHELRKFGADYRRNLARFMADVLPTVTTVELAYNHRTWTGSDITTPIIDVDVRLDGRVETNLPAENIKALLRVLGCSFRDAEPTRYAVDRDDGGHKVIGAAGFKLVNVHDVAVLPVGCNVKIPLRRARFTARIYA